MSESVGNEESYVTKEDQVPVVDDNDNIEEGVDEATADSDAQLGISHLEAPYLPIRYANSSCRAG